MTTALADREILRRYQAVLAPMKTAENIRFVSKRFRANYSVRSTDPLAIPMSKIFLAHALRVEGKSSPAEADATAKTIIEEGQ